MLDFHDPPHARTWHLELTYRPPDPRPKADSPPHSSTAKRCDSAVAKEGDRNSRSSTFSLSKWARIAFRSSSDFLSRKMSMISRRPRNSNCTRRLDRAVPHHVHLSSSHECDKTAAQRQRTMRRSNSSHSSFSPSLSSDSFPDSPPRRRRPSFCCGGHGEEEEDDIWSIIFGLRLPRSSLGRNTIRRSSVDCLLHVVVGRSSVGPRSPQSHPARGEMSLRS